MKCPKCQHENPETQKYCGECATALTPVDEDQPSFTKTLETPTEELATGSVFVNRYQVIEELGKGGMGNVYKVLDKEINAKIALKLIKPEIAADMKTIERFRNELITARDISHKNVCRMYDLGKDKNNYFITMEYIEGQDLKGLIRQSHQLAIGTTISIASQICEGLGEAHKRGIIHRDLKPSNIMIDQEGNARIMDFGIARSSEAKKITGAGVMIGTPHYMSPEQLEGKETDQRSDIYSLGVILYEMVTGRIPFEGDTPIAIGVKHKSEIPRDPKELNTQIPDDLSGLILKCLEKERNKRYQSTREIRSELAKIKQGFPTTDRVIPKKKPLTSREITVTFGLKKLLIPALAIAASTILIFVVLKFIPKRKPVFAPKIGNSILISSFGNLTGDEDYDSFRRSIQNLLITNLENAGFFSYVVSWERMRDLAKQLGKGDVDYIESDLGFDICRREGVEALVTGNLSKAGDMYVIDMRVLDAETMKHIKTHTSEGRGEESIFNQINELSREIAEGIGIPNQRIEETKMRIVDVTTTSLDAYDAYLQGKDERTKVLWAEANFSFKRAVDLDPQFAMAYLHLSETFNALANPEGRIENLRKAKQLSERATEKERLYIEASYARFVEEDLDKGRRILQELTKKYPKEKEAYRELSTYYRLRDPEKEIELLNKALDLDPDFGSVHNRLGYRYRYDGNFAKSIEHFERYVSIDPSNPNARDSLADALFWQGRVDDALEKYKEALEIKPDFHVSMRCISYLYAFKEDYEEALKRIDSYVAAHLTPNHQTWGYTWKGFYCAWLGRFDESLSYLTQAQEFAESYGNQRWKYTIDWIRVLICLENGQTDLAKQYNTSWYPFIIQMYPDDLNAEVALESLYLYFRARIDLLEGNLGQAKSRLVEGKALSDKISVPITRERRQYLYQALEGEILLTEGYSDKVITLLELEKHPPPQGLESADVMILGNSPFKKDILARAHLQKGDVDRAIQEYERLTSFDPNSKNRRLIHPLYYFRLAKLFEQKNKISKAIENYEKFLDLWKDADPGLPEVEDARKRLAGLR